MNKTIVLLLIVMASEFLFGYYVPSYGPQYQWGTWSSTQQSLISIDGLTLMGDPNLSAGTPDDGLNFGSGFCYDENCDILAAIYNGNVVGWAYFNLVYGEFHIPINLEDQVTDETVGYPTVVSDIFEPILTFNFYDYSENIVYYNVFSLPCPGHMTQLRVDSIDIIGSGYECSSNGFQLGQPEEYCLSGIGCNSSESEYFDAIGDSNIDCNGIYIEEIVDCDSELNGEAYIDDCGICAGGNTGINPNQNGCYGCTYENADNYNPNILFEDGSCEFTPTCEPVEYDLIYGNNLLSYTGTDNCQTINALGDLEVNFVIGKGEILSYDEEAGEWIGNLTNLSNQSGYWINTTNPLDNFTWSLDCPESTSLGLGSVLPDLYDYNQSINQAFYLINDININNKSANEGDILLAYNNDILVGVSYYNNETTTLAVMGRDISSQTEGFLEQGDRPTLRLYQEQTGNILNLESDLEGFSNLLVSKVEIINGNTDLIPLEYTLNPAYPNPFNPSTNISYLLPEDKHVNVSIYDLDGRKVETLVQSKMPAGNYTIKWNATDLASGVYFVKLDAGEFTQTQKLMFVK